jgi:hypothetical protein
MVCPDEYTLEYLLAFDGRIHHLEQGYWLKFEIRRIPPSAGRPHGLRYSFTLHDPGGRRLIGFDNAHSVPAKGSRHAATAVQYDHWHRTETDQGRAYRFTTADALLADFFAEVRRVLAERGISDSVTGEEDRLEKRSR